LFAHARPMSLRHRVPGDPAPATLGKGFVFDAIRVGVWSVPLAKDDCKDDGWQGLRNGDGEKFKSQGDCVSFVNRAR
jgi:hypothetical protein